MEDEGSPVDGCGAVMLLILAFWTALLGWWLLFGVARTVFYVTALVLLIGGVRGLLVALRR